MNGERNRSVWLFACDCSAFWLLLHKNNDRELLRIHWKPLGIVKKQKNHPKKNSIFAAIYSILIDTSKIIFDCRFSSIHIQIPFTNQFEPVGKLKTKEIFNFCIFLPRKNW
jgi:hypothetical protein